MKEPNYSKFREIIRTPRMMGNPTLRALAYKAEEIGISLNAYNMVHEGFWDLYCKKPFPSTGLTTKKLETFINYVNLKVSPF
jgi:hypothetical protein